MCRTRLYLCRMLNMSKVRRGGIEVGNDVESCLPYIEAAPWATMR